MMRIDPGAIGFTSGFSQEHKYSMVGEKITVEQLIELCIIMRISTVGERITVEQLAELSIVMRISRYEHVYRHHVRDK